MTRTELNTLIDTTITNKTAPNSITPQNEGDALKAVANYVDQEIEAIELLPGTQGPAGPQGVPGPMGPQGPQGESGANIQKNRGSVTGGTYPNEGQLIYDINVLQPGGNNAFKLPNTSIIGKEIIVDVVGTTASIYGAVSGALAFETSVNISSSQCILAFNDLVKFTCIASNFWLVEHLQRNSVAATPLVSQQVNVSTGTNPEIKFIDFVRLFATADYQTCKLTGPHTVGKEIYIKNPSLFYVKVNGVVENINENSSLTLPPGSYWHFLKEDGGTNSITAFKLSLT